MRVGLQNLMQSSLSASIGEVLDQLGRGNEAGLETVLNRTISDSDREMGLPATSLSMKDQRSTLGNEVRPEIGTEQ